MSDQQINLTQLLDTFQLFDTNKDGSISYNEVCLTKQSNLLLYFISP
jgi:Ca2+-binding EF-hand superfamily protein